MKSDIELYKEVQGMRISEDRRLLLALVNALDNAFISSWQSTHGWQKQLDEARTWLEGN